jgi:hypothetical protein
MAVNEKLHLGVGNISHEAKLGSYYQDFAPAIYHFEHNSFGEFDENGIPYLYIPEGRTYSIVYVIQYGLINHDLMLQGNDAENRKRIVRICLDWLEENSEDFEDSTVWRNHSDEQYDLQEGWISAMYQGQAISLFLRAYQLFGLEKYLHIAEKTFEFFKYDYSEGGVRRVDTDGYIWFEEYPTPIPSLVLNGYIYTMFGFYDLYRVTENKEAKNLFNEGVRTLENNLQKYDVWYWSLYDQLKEQLVSYYYQKNVHIPLMEIMYQLTGRKIFERYAEKWTKNLNNPFHKLIVKIMYRVQPRVKKWSK